jgi:hypothetical protein
MDIKNQKGAAIVEFAIGLPFFVILFAGVLEFSLVFYNKQVLANASKEGARVGIADWKASSDWSGDDPELVDINYIEERVNTYTQNLLITFGDSGTPNTTVLGVGDDDGTYLTVTVDYNYKFLLPSVIGLSPSINLTAETVMMNN